MSIIYWIRFFLASILLIFYFGLSFEPTGAMAQTDGGEGSTGSKRYVTIDFDDVDINVFIKYMSELTGKNFVIDEAVKAKVTIISPTKISVDEAYKVFESVLEVHGYTTIPSGSIIKVVPAVEARSKNIETLLNEAASHPEDKVVTRLIHLEYAVPDEIKKIFTPLISKNSILVSYDPTRTLIITDVQSNINRLIKIINAIDQPGDDGMVTVIPLKHATAEKVAKSILSLFQGPTRAGAQIPVFMKVVPDERTNVLIVFAEPGKTLEIMDLIGNLDKEIPRGEGNIQVYYLENANAEELAKVLTELPGQKKGATGEKGKLPALAKDIRIVADKATNSIVITAAKDDYIVLEEVIRKLDIPRKMVYLETLIMEVTLEKDFDMGFNWIAPGSFNDKKWGYLGSSVFNQGALNSYPVDRLGNLSVPTGLSLGIMGEAIQIGDVVFPSLKAVFNAFKGDRDVNIISAPQLLTTDNEEAQIKVGKNVPYLTKSATGDQNYNTYEYRDVGTTLRITPQINQEGVVRLKVFQEIIGLLDSNEDRPVTTSRSAESTVIVKDGHTVVIGGIIRDLKEELRGQVPGLGDVPILGWFFKSTSNSSEKTNLYLFITPRIVNNPSETESVFQAKRDEIEETMKGPNAVLQGMAGDTDPEPLLKLGSRMFTAGEPRKAKKYYQRALLADSESPEALFYLARIYEMEGDRREATRLYTRLIELGPSGARVISDNPDHEGATFMELGKTRLDAIK